MKRIIGILICIFALFGTLSGCVRSSINVDEPNTEVFESNTEFALDIFSKLNVEDILYILYVI